MVEQEVEVTGPERVTRGAIKRHVRIPAAALIPLAAVRAPRGQRPRFAYLLLGVLEPGLSLLLFDVGLSRTSATHAALLLASETLFVVLLARLTLRERLSPPLAVAVGAGVGGATLASLEPGGAASSLIGDTLVLAASALAAGLRSPGTQARANRGLADGHRDTTHRSARRLPPEHHRLLRHRA